MSFWLKVCIYSHTRGVKLGLGLGFMSTSSWSEQIARQKNQRGEIARRRTCFYINERWCTDVTVLKKMCCSDLETLFINCKPFYSPREFCSFILVSVYIPPHANARSALQKLADQITETEQQHPDSVLIILGDFNKANLSRELPKIQTAHSHVPPETVIYWITVTQR